MHGKDAARELCRLRWIWQEVMSCQPENGATFFEAAPTQQGCSNLSTGRELAIGFCTTPERCDSMKRSTNGYLCHVLLLARTAGAFCTAMRSTCVCQSGLLGDKTGESLASVFTSVRMCYKASTTI